jgi:hypothetical protein
MSRPLVPIQADLENVLAQVGSPVGREDTDPMLRGDRVLLTFDLSAWEVDGSVLVQKGQSVTVENDQNDPIWIRSNFGFDTRQEPAGTFARTETVSANSGQSDRGLLLSVDSFAAARIQVMIQAQHISGNAEDYAVVLWAVDGNGDEARFWQKRGTWTPDGQGFVAFNPQVPPVISGTGQSGSDVDIEVQIVNSPSSTGEVILEAEAILAFQ